MSVYRDVSSMAPASRPGSRLLVYFTLSVFAILALSSTVHGDISTLSKGKLLTGIEPYKSFKKSYNGASYL